MFYMQSDIEKIDVFERNLGFNNYEMWKQCELLRSVVFQMVETKVGRGKSVRVIKSFKHSTPSEIRQRIVNSCEYYKKLYEMEKKETGSLEVVKYRFEKINGEPKIIIDMVKVLDKNGQYIKFAKLEGVVNYLSKYPIKFKEL
jgi:hypothetical protein